MSEGGTWPATSGATDWRTMGTERPADAKAADLLQQHHGFHTAAERSYGVYLAISILLLGVIAVYALAQLLTSLGGLNRALGH